VPSYPDALCRKRPYWVAEKSDGERVLLLSLSSGSYLVDPSFNIYKVKDAPNGGDRARFLLPKVGDINTPQDKVRLFASTQPFVPFLFSRFLAPNKIDFPLFEIAPRNSRVFINT